MSPLIRPLRSLANGVGVAWWARVQTSGPDVTYWFGPFITRKGLESELTFHEFSHFIWILLVMLLHDLGGFCSDTLQSNFAGDL